jgi:periplasmic protein CpxP/Spy
MKKPFGGVALLAVAALLSVPPAALAQSGSAPAPSAAAPSAASAPSNDAALQRVEARIKQLHSQLHITAAEDPQWQQFAQTMRDNAREVDEAAMQRAQQYPTMNAVENLQSYEALAETHVQHLQKLIPAFQSLYDAMSPEQKKTADEVFRPGPQARNGGNQ